MEKFKDKFCVFICLCVVLMKAAAERQYFTLNMSHTWTEARSHCQVCFKDLVTVTPENSQIVAGMISSDHWIGLRKTYNSTSNFTFDSAFTSAPPSTTFSFTSEYGFTDNSTDNPTLYWTRWVNGDPLFFQNWYPGWPVPRYPLPKIDCCSCSCTCPVPPTTSETPIQPTTSPTGSGSPTGRSTQSKQTVSDFPQSLEPNTNMDTSFTGSTDTRNSSQTTNQRGNVSENSTPQSVYTTHSPWTTTTPKQIESTCESRPMEPPVIPEPYKYYIEDSCVAMLSFGPWIEKHCFELLPFICYEDRFMGAVNVTEIRASSASLSWLPAPGDIQYYRVEITGDQAWVVNESNLTFSLDLDNLTAGTGYNISVFPVKCDRDLNSQNRTFYTIPSTVENLTASYMTETSVTLNWTKPQGNLGFYLIKTGVLSNETKGVQFEFGGLARGTCYTFTVLTGVDDRSLWSEPAYKSQCTKPGIVTDLRALNNTYTSVVLLWSPPDGNYTGFLVTAYNSSMLFFNQRVNSTAALVDGLPDGQKINFTVIAEANFSLQGRPQNISSYTAPRSVSNLVLKSTDISIDASWTFMESPDVYFTAELMLGTELVNTTSHLNTHSIQFGNLKTAAKYSVTVYAVIDVIKSQPVSDTIFTLPNPPSNARVSSTTNNSISFKWDPPWNNYNVTYGLKISSDFWNTETSQTVVNQTSYEFTGLVSGTNYTFEVFTKTDTNSSSPATCSGVTDAVTVTLSLSMLCSSETLLLCDDRTTREYVFEELTSFFYDFLEDDIIWNITKDKT